MIAVNASPLAPRTSAPNVTSTMPAVPIRIAETITAIPTDIGISTGSAGLPHFGHATLLITCNLTISLSGGAQAALRPGERAISCEHRAPTVFHVRSNGLLGVIPIPDISIVPGSTFCSVCPEAPKLECGSGALTGIAIVERPTPAVDRHFLQQALRDE